MVTHDPGIAGQHDQRQQGERDPEGQNYLAEDKGTGRVGTSGQYGQ